MRPTQQTHAALSLSQVPRCHLTRTPRSLRTQSQAGAGAACPALGHIHCPQKGHPAPSSPSLAPCPIAASRATDHRDKHAHRGQSAAHPPTPVHSCSTPHAPLLSSPAPPSMAPTRGHFWVLLNFNLGAWASASSHHWPHPGAPCTTSHQTHLHQWGQASPRGGSDIKPVSLVLISGASHAALAGPE